MHLRCHNIIFQKIKIFFSKSEICVQNLNLDSIFINKRIFIRVQILTLNILNYILK